MTPEEQYIKIDKDGNKSFYKEKEMHIQHRLDGPAVEFADGSKIWFVDGKQHRLDGPAYEWSNGRKEWWVNGKFLSKKEFDAFVKPVEQYQKEINDLLYICQESINKNAKSVQALDALQGEIEMTYKYYAGFGAKKDLTTTEMLNHILRTVPNYKPTDKEHDLEDMKRHCAHYIESLQEIAKKNRKAETCRMIALKALGELTDEEHQPELLIEENLKLRMQLEDLESKIANSILDKVFSTDKDPFIELQRYCDECDKQEDSFVEEQKILDNADKHSKMYL